MSEGKFYEFVTDKVWYSPDEDRVHVLNNVKPVFTISNVQLSALFSQFVCLTNQRTCGQTL